MELFEEIRREYEHGAGTIRGVAKKLGVHRRMVREALGQRSSDRTQDSGPGKTQTGTCNLIHQRYT